MFSYVRLSDGGPARHEGPRSEVAVLTNLARRVVGDRGSVRWDALESHEQVRQLIAHLVPGMESIAEIGRTRREFHIPGRRLDTPRFPTPSGRARFHPIAELHPAAFPPSHAAEGISLRLMTVRSEGQFNTVVYEDADLYRGQERRDVVLLHPDDIRRLGLRDDQLVTVRSAAGELAHRRVRPFDIRPGNAMMYFPEANVLVPRNIDPRSKTPAFKSVLVEVIAE
jgi:anaerobic selenocysteine-containing dehydrogenase